MPPSEEEQAKILLDARVAKVATENIALVASGRFTTEQVAELSEIDRDYLERTKECVERSA